jgi:hypothetical protein
MRSGWEVRWVGWVGGGDYGEGMGDKVGMCKKFNGFWGSWKGKIVEEELGMMGWVGGREVE